MPTVDHAARAVRRVEEVVREAKVRPPVAESLHDRIRRRAFELFLARCGGSGDALSDWLEAERQVHAADVRRPREDARASQRGEALLAIEND
ncbi:MAG: DUF2934 domain-containing protein [Phycisphaerae bacterium]|jgi:hypothetical protein